VIGSNHVSSVLAFGSKVNEIFKQSQPHGAGFLGMKLHAHDTLALNDRRKGIAIVCD
jgi:hypothetical protein